MGHKLTSLFMTSLDVTIQSLEVRTSSLLFSTTSLGFFLLFPKFWIKDVQGFSSTRRQCLFPLANRHDPNPNCLSFTAADLGLEELNIYFPDSFHPFQVISQQIVWQTVQIIPYIRLHSQQIWPASALETRYFQFIKIEMSLKQIFFDYFDII